MNAKLKKRSKTALVQALKIALGSSLSILIATLLGLEFATSAGIITLLTVLTTKLETLWLSLYRLISFMGTILLSIVIFQFVPVVWIAFGLFIFLVIFASELVGWRATISVNAVIGTHYITTFDFSMMFMFNEFCLVAIGISVAILLNIFNRSKNTEVMLMHNMEFVEGQLQQVLHELAQYLHGEQMDHDVWADTLALEHQLEHFIEVACEFNMDTFKTDGDYYEHYFEMRLMQCSILQSLQSEFRRMRAIKKHADIVADYILEIEQHVLELNDPEHLIVKLEEITARIINEQLPQSKEEFEDRTKLYHVLMDLEEFLMHKQRFVESVRACIKYKKDYHYLKK